MTNFIHSTSIVHPNAQLGKGVNIGPFCVVGEHVELGDSCVLKSHVVIDGYTKIGEGTVIYPFASLGHAPQDLKYHGEPSELIIGQHNTIREYCTMNPGTETGNMRTVVGSHSLFMMSTHVAHDCIIGDHVIMANNATLGGHVEVGSYAIIGGLAAVHQFVRIGHHAMIGGMSGVESDVIPYGRVKGDRAYLAGINLIGVERGGFDKGQIKALQKAFEYLFQDSGTLDERIAQAEQDFIGHEAVVEIINFARAKKRFPLCSPPRK